MDDFLTKPLSQSNIESILIKNRLIDVNIEIKIN